MKKTIAKNEAIAKCELMIKVCTENYHASEVRMEEVFYLSKIEEYNDKLKELRQ
jgi:hypothetical protein